MKKLIRSVILLASVLLLISCGSKVEDSADTKEVKVEAAAHEAGVMKWSLDADPKTLDPQLNSATGAGSVINNMYEGLMREVDSKLIPAMAESYELSEDGLKYTFHLRDSRWSDGKPVSAEDFKYAWLRALNPNVASEYAFQMFYIKGAKDYYEGKSLAEEVAITVVDDKTIEVELDTPTPYFLNLTAFYTYFPVRRDMVEQDPDRWAVNPKLAVSNGPFKLTKYALSDELVLEKNNKYWDAESVKLNKIVTLIIGDSMTALTAYEQDEIFILDTMPPQEVMRLQLEDPTFQILPMLGTYYYIFNVDREPTNNLDVRKALSMAIDRRAITEKVKKGGEIPARGFIPEGLYDSEGSEFRGKAGDYYIDTEGADVEGARTLLAKAGYPNGEGFPKMTILYNTSDSHKAIAEAIQAMWRETLGIEVELMNQEWAVFQDTIRVGNFQVGRASWIGDYVDPMTFLELWTSYSGKNGAQWRWTEDGKFSENKRYDELVRESKMVSGARRDAKLYEMEKLIMDEAIVAPIYYYVDQVMVKPYLGGWNKNVLDTWYFGRAEITK